MRVCIFVEARRDLDVGDVVEAHLPFLDRAFVEYLGRDRFRGEVDAFALGLIEHGREEAHLELEGEDVDARRSAFAALGDDFLDEEPTDGEVDRSDDDEPTAVLAVEEAAFGSGSAR